MASVVLNREEKGVLKKIPTQHFRTGKIEEKTSSLRNSKEEKSNLSDSNNSKIHLAPKKIEKEHINTFCG